MGQDLSLKRLHYFYGKIYLSVGRKYNTGPILPSDGQIAQFIFLVIKKWEFIFTLLLPQAKAKPQ
jgi:hypothetical protein